MEKDIKEAKKELTRKIFDDIEAFHEEFPDNTVEGIDLVTLPVAGSSSCLISVDVHIKVNYTFSGKVVEK